MSKYPKITHVLGTVFNIENGLSEADAIRLYKRTYGAGDQLESIKIELIAAFSDQEISWKSMLLNPDFEVIDAESEDEAKVVARRLLWEPLLKM